MKHTAGIVIIMGDKILMGHPTGSKWYNSYSIPKGLIDPGETQLQAAMRETLEEVGVNIKKSQITSGPHTYKYPKGKKELTFYIVIIDDIKEIGLNNEVINKSFLKPNSEGILEIDWAGFITFKEARKRASKPMQKLLDILDSIYNPKQECFKLKNYQKFNDI
jgi:predicted NUDIX family NTP pyrophosphohydrolase